MSAGKGCFIRLASDSDILSEIIIKSCLDDQTVTAESRNNEENVCISRWVLDTERDCAKADILEKGIHCICISTLSLEVALKVLNECQNTVINIGYEIVSDGFIREHLKDFSKFRSNISIRHQP